MFYVVTLDWNRRLVVKMNKESTAAIETLFDQGVVYTEQYNSQLGGTGFVPSDWDHQIVVMKAERLHNLITVGDAIVESQSKPEQEAEAA